MQWILQEFEDTKKLGDALQRRGIPFTWHKVVPFIGDLEPTPTIEDKNAVVMFGSYSLWRYSQRMQLSPGVFKLEPFVNQSAWQPYLLNGQDALFLKLEDIPIALPEDEDLWFFRPVDDSKEEPGQVLSSKAIHKLAKRVLALDIEKIPNGSLRHDTSLMLTEPVDIFKEWRIWIVKNQVVTYSIYKEGTRVTYRHEIDQDVYGFALNMVNLNPNYAEAYVIDVCRTAEGLRLIETNCINAAGFYAADLHKLCAAIDSLR